MKNTFKLKTLALSVAMASSSMAILAPTAAQAEVTGNAGIVSQYIFRGLPQSSGAAAQGGIDYANESGFYAGIWSSTVATPGGADGGYGLELEYDLYAGFETEVSGVTLGAGVTLYRYTQKVWDTSYDELNLWAGFGDFSLTANFGSHADAKTGGGDQSYTVVTASYAFGDAYVLYGMGQDFITDVDHSWFEFGYAAAVTDTLEAGVTLIYTDKDGSGFNKVAGGETKGNLSMVVGLTKSFDLM